MSCAACAASSCAFFAHASTSPVHSCIGLTASSAAFFALASHNCALTFANAASACILSTALLQHDSTSSVHSCTSFAACSASSCAFATAPCKSSIECLAASLTESAASSAASDASLATSSVPSCPTFIPDFKPFTASAISVAPCTIAFASRPKSVNLSANSSKSFVSDAPASSTQSDLLLQFSASSRIAAASVRRRRAQKKGKRKV